MTPTEQSANTASTPTSCLFALLLALFCVKGSGARKTGRGVVPTVLLAVLGVSAFVASPASATEQFVPGITFGAPGSGNGQLDEPVGLAVNDSALGQAAGDVYVADKGNNRVQRFSSAGTFEGEFNGTGTFPNENGKAASQPLSGPEWVAVDNDPTSASFEDVYVTDNAHKVVDKFTATGEYLGQLTGTCEKPEETAPCPGSKPLPFGELFGVTVGPSGNVWVYDSNRNFDEFGDTGSLISAVTTLGYGQAEPGGLGIDSSEEHLYANEGRPRNKVVQYASATGNRLLPVETFPEQASGIAVASLTDDVFVDTESSLRWFGPIVEYSQAPLESFAENLSGSHGVAVNGEATTVYASEQPAGNIEVFDRVSLPKAVTEPSVELGNTEETLKGTVLPEGTTVSGCEFEYGLQAAKPGHYGHSAPCEQAPGSITGVEVPVSVTVPELQPGATYHYRLRASDAKGTASGEELTFTLFPTAGGESVSGVGSSSATLHAQVGPDGESTDYFFEYGPTEAYGSVTHTSIAGAGLETVDVLASVEGLTPDTTYHFRVVASSRVKGTTRGDDASFSTLPVGLLGLPDDRGYELVSPLGNGDAQVTGGVRAAGNGDAVVYLGQPPVVGGNGQEGGPAEGLTTTEGDNEYLARRSGNGEWVAGDIQPDGLGLAQYQSFSNDLSVGILGSPEPVFEGAPKENALYSQDLSADSYSLLGANMSYDGSTPDGSHLLVSGESGGLYETVGGRLDAVNVLAGGRPAANAVFGAPPFNRGFPPDLSHVVSDDGSRVFWTENNAEGKPEKLFVSEGVGGPGERTVQVDASQAGGAGGGGRFLTASSDGSRVIFTDCERLTADSTAVPTTGCERIVEQPGEESYVTPSGNDLYEYDVETGVLTDLSVDTVNAGEHAEVVGVLGASEDGSYVYFAAGVALSSEATPQACLEGTTSTFYAGILTKCNVYVVHGGEAPRLVATVTNAESADWNADVGGHDAFVSADGRHLVFESAQDLTGFDSGGAHEIYMYDFGGGLLCVSCNQSGALSVPFSGYPNEEISGPHITLPTSAFSTYALRDMSSDGNRVFFDSDEGLVAQDTNNGLQKVYEWERDGSGSCERAKGCLYLLSGDTSTDNSSFIDASETGDDVFILTRADLVPRDREELFEVYDARVGAPEEPTPPECSGAGCQGVPGAPPIFATPSSVTFNGVGNFPPPPAPKKTTTKKTVKCPKGKKLSHGKCVKSKKKIKKAKKAKKASNDRRAE